MTAKEIYDSINNYIMNLETDTAVGNDLLKLCYTGKEDEAIKYIKDFFKCDDKTAEDAFNIFKSKTGAPPSQQQIAHANAVAREALNQLKCPTCQSINLKKISTTSKVMNTALFGIFGTKRHKTFHCNNCGYEW